MSEFDCHGGIRSRRNTRSGDRVLDRAGEPQCTAGAIQRQTENGGDHGRHEIGRHWRKRQRVRNPLAQVQAGEQRGVGDDGDREVAKSPTHSGVLQ